MITLKTLRAHREAILDIARRYGAHDIPALQAQIHAIVVSLSADEDDAG